MKKFILLFFSAFLFACPVFSEQINWETIERLSKENNPLIKTAHFKLENAKQAYNRSLSGFFPNVSLTGSTSQSGGQDNFTRNNSYGLNSSLSVFSGFETYNDVKQKAAELKAAEISYIRTVSDIVYEGALAYINLMWACETVELSKQIYERRKENRDMIKLKYNSGNVDIGSLERVEADVEMANYDLKKALRNIESVSSALLKVIGRNDSSTLEALEKINIDFQE
ncbi:MAG: TolC family protein, partial [Endomicrobium sp.]|nr:TolC family protein [Endomicrobium sp.]